MLSLKLKNNNPKNKSTMVNGDYVMAASKEAIFSIMLMLSMALSGWALSNIYAHEKRITTMEASRFTRKEGNFLMVKTTEADLHFKYIKKSLETLDRKIDYLNDRVEHISTKE